MHLIQSVHKYNRKEIRECCGQASYLITDMAVIQVTEESFEEEVLQSKVPVLVDFWAIWCAPCQILAPILEKIAEENENVKICKVNVDEQMDLAQEYEVMSIPTLVLFHEGEIVNKIIGVQSEDEILDMLKNKEVDDD